MCPAECDSPQALKGFQISWVIYMTHLANVKGFDPPHGNFTRRVTPTILQFFLSAFRPQKLPSVEGLKRNSAVAKHTVGKSVRRTTVICSSRFTFEPRRQRPNKMKFVIPD